MADYDGCLDVREEIITHLQDDSNGINVHLLALESRYEGKYSLPLFSERTYYRHENDHEWKGGGPFCAIYYDGESSPPAGENWQMVPVGIQIKFAYTTQGYKFDWLEDIILLIGTAIKVCIWEAYPPSFMRTSTKSVAEVHYKGSLAYPFRRWENNSIYKEEILRFEATQKRA